MKKWFAIFLSLVLIYSCFIVTADAVTDSKKFSPALDAFPQLSSQEDAVTYYLSQSEQDNFGGIYYDDDGILVVNTVGTTPRAALYSQKNQEIGVRYQTVTYSLCDLETVKDFLAEYMDEYSILALDANEVTNQVDVCLKSYTKDTIAQIENLVRHQYPDMDCLHFEDYSDYTISFTVGYETSVQTSSETNEDNAYSLPPTSETTIIPGTQIKIKNYFYTLGPATSSSIAYSAGHGFTGKQAVSAFVSPTDPLGISVGTASPQFGGIAMDSSTITAGLRIKFGFITQLRTPIVGKSVKMLGSVSGAQTGKIKRTNQTITVEAMGDTPKAQLFGMCEADYRCAQGDSGAGIFDAANPLAYHYGIQSSAVFDSNKNWVGPSYFTPLFH